MRVDVQDGDATMIFRYRTHDRVGNRVIAAKHDRTMPRVENRVDAGLISALPRPGRRSTSDHRRQPVSKGRATFGEAVALGRGDRLANQPRRRRAPRRDDELES